VSRAKGPVSNRGGEAVLYLWGLFADQRSLFVPAPR